MKHHPAVRGAAGFGVLVVFLFAGEWVSRLAALPIPGSVVGMVLLTVALRTGAVSPALVRDAAGLLLRHMGLLFVPAGAGVMRYTGLIQAEWPAILGAGVVSTLVVMAVVGTVHERMAGDA
jgi:holin-like protein